MKGKLVLIPTYLSESNDKEFIPDQVKNTIKEIDYFLVENVRTSRRYISSLSLDIDISELRFEVMDKRSTIDDIDNFCLPMLNGTVMGVISEAGLPAIADPGNLAVSWAHQNNIKVIPLSGGSSIQLALISSGFNGQHFTFHGYLPIDAKERKSKVKELLNTLNKSGYTQVFMETPFRNNQLLKSLIEILPMDCLLSVAADITGSTEFVKTQSIRSWKQNPVDLHKTPAIFSIGTFNI